MHIIDHRRFIALTPVGASDDSTDSTDSIGFAALAGEGVVPFAPVEI